MIKAVIFDLDGVLVSTDELHDRGWSAPPAPTPTRRKMLAVAVGDASGKGCGDFNIGGVAALDLPLLNGGGPSRDTDTGKLIIEEDAR